MARSTEMQIEVAYLSQQRKVKPGDTVQVIRAGVENPRVYLFKITSFFEGGYRARGIFNGKSELWSFNHRGRCKTNPAYYVLEVGNA